MKLTVFELKKLHSDKLLTVLAVLAVCAAAVFAFLTSKPLAYDRAAAERVLASFQAEPVQTYRVWEEKQEAYRAYLSDEYASDSLPPFLDDYDDYRRAWEMYSRQTRYRDRLETVLRETNKTDPVSVYITSLYTRNQALRLSRADMACLPDLFDALAFASFLILPLSALLGISVSLADRKRGTEQLLFATPRGRTRVRLGKLAAACICVLCLCAALFAAALVPFVLQNGSVPWGEYLQNHESFFICPYPLTVWQAVLLLYLLASLGAFALCMMSCLLGKLFRRQAVALLFASLPVVGLGALSLLTTPDGRSLLHLVSPFSFCDGNVSFGHLYGTKIGTFAVGGLPLVAFAWAMLCVLLCICYALHHVRAVSAVGLRKLPFALPSACVPRFVKTVCAFETAKQFVCNKPFYLLLPLLFVFFLQASSAIVPDDSYEEETYRAYMVELQGAYTEEKHQKVNDLLASAQQTLSQKDEMDALFASGELSREEMAEFLRRFGKAQSEEQALLRVSERLDFVRSAGQDAELVYDSGWNLLFALRFHPLPVLLLCAVCCGLFADEYKNGMHRLIPFPVRRRVALSKLAFALCFAFLAVLCFEAVSVGLIAHRILLASPFASSAGVAPAQSFGSLPLVLSACLSVLHRALGYLSVALVCTLCSRLLRQKHAAFVCGVVSALPWLVC